MAAYFPDKPNKQQSEDASKFVEIVGNLYPCGDCAEHLRERVKHHPPDTRSRAAFSRWMCETHNEVNERLGKPVFDCSKVDERWRDGPSDGSCD